MWLTSISYTLICTSTDYDAWRVGEAPVTVAEVVKTLHTNAAHARAVAEGLLQKVHDHVAAGKLTEVKGSMQWSCVTSKEVCFAQRVVLEATELTAYRLNLSSRGRDWHLSCLTTKTRGLRRYA